MRAILTSRLRVDEPFEGADWVQHDRLRLWCEEELTLLNPDWVTRGRLNLYRGNVPQFLSLYYEDGDALILPFGALDLLKDEFELELDDQTNKDCHLPFLKPAFQLYDYQEEAVTAMLEERLGVLQAPPGSGKTMMGLMLASERRGRTLWLTHTIDLLQQSYDRARSLFPDAPERAFGRIGNHHFSFGTHITFATVQTMAKLDPSEYRDKFEVVIVDECHRVAGTVTKFNQFSKVLSHCNAGFKYGLSATPQRKDGLTMCIYAHLGEIKHVIARNTVLTNTIKPSVIRLQTGYTDPQRAYRADGTFDAVRGASEMGRCYQRNHKIASHLRGEESTLILGNRIEQLLGIRSLMNLKELGSSAVLTAKTKRRERAELLDKMRSGDLRYLFATYPLAKEGLDIPRLERLVLASPTADRTTLVQSIGRIERACPGKTKSVVYDFVDASNRYGRQANERERIYRQLGLRIEERKKKNEK